MADNDEEIINHQPPAAPPPLLVVVGPTASGKSDLGLELAKRLGGEIVCADARTVYRSTDIGTAKPSLTDRREVPHHLLDIIEPDQSFSAADFKDAADKVIAEIQSRHRLPIMVGGTGLYIDAVLYDFDFRTPPDPVLRTELSKLDVGELQDRLRAMGIPLPVNEGNPRHLIRAIETRGQTHRRRPLGAKTVVIGLDVDQQTLYERIERRVLGMYKAGLRQEAEKLALRYGWQAPGLHTIGYQEWVDPANNQSIDDQAVLREIIKNTKAYAKRQRTWFKRNNSIHWLNDPSSYVEITTTLVNKLQ